jgi:zinc protease
MEFLADQILAAFGDEARVQSGRTSLDVVLPAQSDRAVVVVEGKEQTDVAMAIPVQGVSAEGYYDLDLANGVLGQYGMMGRVGDSVRQKQGLAYYAYCSITPGKTQSLWFARAGVDPANVDRAIESIMEVVRDATENGLAADELNGTRQLMTGSLALTMQTNNGIAQLLQTIEEFELGLDYVERYPQLLAAVTLESAQQALAQAIDLGRFQIGIAGPRQSDNSA